MQLLKKVTSKAFICKIYIDYIGALTPVSSSENQNFFDAKGNEFTWRDTHFGKQSVSFRETEKQTKAGSIYTQSLKISFPNTDDKRTDRIEKIKTAKFIQIALSNGQLLVMGRNDYHQNKKPVIKASSTALKTTITFTTESMFSVGYLHIQEVSEFVEFLYPSEVPNQLITV
jgi:hypothetical protein